jgi:hypothetical protein
MSPAHWQLFLDDHVPIRAHRTECPAVFRGTEKLDALRGKRVCLFFETVDADLYGFRVK